MRRFIYILLPILIVMFSDLSAQWRQITNIPTQFRDNYWLEIFFLKDKPQYGWACGYNGMVIRTTDGGETWQGVKIPYAAQIESIHFVNERVGYAISVTTNFDFGSVIYKTTDGGETWSDDYSIKEGFSLWGCNFLTEDYGIAVGGYCDGTNLFYLTENGGKTWKKFEKNFVYNTKLADILLHEQGTSYAISSGRLWNSTDGGKTWSVFSETGGSDWHEEISHLNNSFLVPFDVGCNGTGIKGGARFSSDGGRTWKNTDLPFPCYGSALTNDSSGWVCGKNRTIYYTEDRGKHWIDRHCGIPAGTHLDDLYFFDDTTGFVVGEGIFKYDKIDTLKPEIEASSLKICHGESITLRAVGEFENYLWNTGATTSEITINEPGEYSLKTFSNDCDTGRSNTLKIDYNPVFVLSFNSTYQGCDGDTIFFDISGQAESILWEDGSEDFARNFTKSGVYRFTATDSNGCSLQDSITINLLPYPLTNIIPGSCDTTVCNTVGLELYTENQTKCNWYNAENDCLIASNTQSITIYEPAKIYIVATNENGCTSRSEINTYNILPTSDIFSFGDSENEILDFPTTRYGETSRLSVSVYNDSSANVNLSSIRLASNTEFNVPQSQFPVSVPALGSAELLVCFTPKSLGERTDTLKISDACSLHKVILRGYCPADTMETTGNCSLPVLLITKEISGGGQVAISAAYPNPADAKISVDYTYRHKTSSENPDIDIRLADLFGNKIFDISENIESASFANSEYALTENGTLTLDLSRISSGSYLLIFEINCESVAALPVIINK